MTVTLSPELSHLLTRTGAAWPAPDEDQIAAMAEGWHSLGSRLDTVRGDYRDAQQSVAAAGRGAGVAAFGDWTAGIHEWLLQLVEVCARVEAWLISIARAVYEAKTAIVGVLDDLARRIDRVERDLAGVPVIGDALATPVQKVIEPWFADVRATVTRIAEKASGLVVDTAVPGLVSAVEWVKSVVQGLRKLLKLDLGADWPTTPSGHPNPANKPTGHPDTVHPNDQSTKPRDLRYENEAAVTLARAGYDVEQSPVVTGRKNPDYRIAGKIFDCVSPTTASAYSIWSNIKKKKVDKGQTDRVIININAPDAQANVDDLRRQFQDYPMPGLKEAKVIVPGGAIIDIYP